MNQHHINSFAELPSAKSSKLIDFDSIEIYPGIIPDTFFLVVAGTKPWLSMSVRLQPMIYVMQPEYWEIEVVATMSGVGIPVVAPYESVLDISHLRGTKGIEVIGATKRERREV